MMAGWHGGKGSKSRPVNRQKFADNWDAIFGKKTEVKEDVLDTYNDERLVSKFDKAAVEPTYAFNSHGTHAQERTVFEVDMGDLPAEDVNDYIEKIKKDIDINNK